MGSGNKTWNREKGAERKTAIFYISDDALCLAKRIRGLYQNAIVLRFKAETVSLFWNEYKTLIFILASGIVVRTIAPLIKSKKTDPAVLVLSKDGNFVISLLCGHEGGANKIAQKMADFLGAQAVITTASEINNLKPETKKPKLRNLIIGIGCNRGTSASEIEDAVEKTLGENNLTILSVHSIATIDKKADEKGLIVFAQRYHLEINTFTPDELNRVNGILKSEAVFKATGANAVAEPAAILASGADSLLIPKQKRGNVTIAVAEKGSGVKGKIFIVGTGPGGIEHITPYAQKSINRADVIVGYETYLELIQELIKGKEIVSTGMTQEIERCKKAVELASTGKTVAVISGGDPGIYAMAGLVFELLKYQGITYLQVEVIPGISALTACASRLGAPIMHDFACISLSDRLTSWELIEKRLIAAAQADFVIVIYNPKSIGRQEHINRARDIILGYRSSEIPVGIVKSAMRDDERIVITTLGNMLDCVIDMQTTIIIGNSQTFRWDGWMITPRGYKGVNSTESRTQE